MSDIRDTDKFSLNVQQLEELDRACDQVELRQPLDAGEFGAMTPRRSDHGLT